MNWLLKPQPWPHSFFVEPKLNCESCVVAAGLVRSQDYQPESKCCRFSPYLGAVAVGALLSEDPDWNPPSGDLILTGMGLVHTLSHRREKKVCEFLSPVGRCQVWNQRPVICFSFFCASERPRGLEQYKKIEAFLLREEAAILKSWFDSRWNDDRVWIAWCEFMEEAPTLETLPKELLFESWSEARACYLECYRWFRENFSQLDPKVCYESVHA
ncbi:MAG: hypothetical protein AAF203_04435 [Pseudomonadota bacterium]